MESVDPKKMQVLLLVDTKKGQKWLDYTQKVISAQPYGNGIHIVFSSGDKRTFGHARARLYNQVMHRKIGELDLVYVDGDLRRNVEHVYELRTSDASVQPRYVLEYRNKEGNLGTCTRVGSSVSLDLMTETQRQCLPIMKYVREEVRAQAVRVGATWQGEGNKRWSTAEHNAKPDAILANL